MKRQVFTYIFLSLGVALVLAYLVFAPLQFKLNDGDIKCKNLNISMVGDIEFVTAQEVNDLLRDHDLNPIGVSLDQLRIERIENLLNEHPLVKHASCYHTPNGDVKVLVKLRRPKFLVNAAESYYVDEEKKILPVPLHTVAYVPIVTGRVTKSMAKGELYDFVDYIDSHTFWNAQIDQIHVRNDMKVELVPRMGDAIILLGHLEHYEEKLDRVFRLYHQAFKFMGWNRYGQLDVQYDNQIVATRLEDAIR